MKNLTIGFRYAFSRKKRLNDDFRKIQKKTEYFLKGIYDFPEQIFRIYYHRTCGCYCRFLVYKDIYLGRFALFFNFLRIITTACLFLKDFFVSFLSIFMELNLRRFCSRWVEKNNITSYKMNIKVEFFC